MMVGRNSSMLLIAFCMTASNTHNRGRHSSSISLVDEAGKYLCNTRTHALALRSTAEEVTSSLLVNTHSLQLFTKAFKMCSSELHTNKQRDKIHLSEISDYLSLKKKKNK